jgi:hypothetical protein
LRHVVQRAALEQLLHLLVVVRHLEGCALWAAESLIAPPCRPMAPGSAITSSRPPLAVRVISASVPGGRPTE